MRPVLTMTAIIAVFCWLTTPLEATIRRVPSEYDTLQAAIDAADEGDTVLVADGTFMGIGNRFVHWYEKDLFVTSENGPYHTVVDCGGGNLAMRLENITADSMLRGFTFRNGWDFDNWPGSLLIASYQSACAPVIVDCVFINNEAYLDVYYYTTPTGGAVLSYESDPRFFNCLFIGNFGTVDGYSPARICYAGAIASLRGMVTLTNCTFIDNRMERYEGSHIIPYGTLGCGGFTANNCIVYHGDPIDMHNGVNATYCDIEGGRQGEGNFDALPHFISGYYLSQTAAGQPFDSPCVDAGDKPADQVSITMPDGVLTMSQLTTRTDCEPDTGMVDVGFHYHLTDPVPSPVATSTPAPTPTASCTPTERPATATPTPTVTPPDGTFNLWLELNGTTFIAGNRFILLAMYESTRQYADIPLVVVLDVHGSYYCYPSWREQMDYGLIHVLPGGPHQVDILDFVWPSGAGSDQDVRFHAALLNKELSDMYCLAESVSFGWR
ncbi:hypothetical protein JW905_02520 [bacterium]|nr:hypothetical protein [candidate division CSSED10-310 bacterium]